MGVLASLCSESWHHFVVRSWHHSLCIEVLAVSPGPLCSEVVGLLSILQKVEECYNGHVQLMIFTDCDCLVLILSEWGHSNFQPNPGDMVHLDVVFPLIQWSAKVILIKMKSHAGCFLN